MDGRIRTVNEATLAMLGYAEGDLVGRHISIIEGKEDDIAPMKAVSTGERSWLTRDGRPIPVLYSSAPLLVTGFGGPDWSPEHGFVWPGAKYNRDRRVSRKRTDRRTRTVRSCGCRGQRWYLGLGRSHR